MLGLSFLEETVESDKKPNGIKGDGRQGRVEGDINDNEAGAKEV